MKSHAVLEQLLEALPQDLDFYHLGKVQQQKSTFDFAETYSIGYKLFGDIEALLVVIF